MNGPLQGRRARGFFLFLLPLLGSVALPASPSGAEEGPTVSANTVVEGLKTIQRAGAEVVENAEKDKVKAEQEASGIHPIWEMIETTIRNNSKDSYVAFEDALDDLGVAAKAGDAKKAEAAAAAFDSLAKKYVAQFSGSAAASAAPARAADAAPKQAAAPKESAAAAAKPAPAERKAAAATTAPAAEVGSGTLARTGPSSALAALAGAAFGLGGLAIIGGARRRRPSPIA